MPYIANVPQPNDLLSDSQSQILGNFQQLDTSFGIDHYTYSNATPNNGKHNQVTTPAQGSHPATSASEPKFYGMQDSANVGVIQYSRGGSSAVPTPLTSLHSGALALSLGPASPSTANVLDCTGLTLGFFNLMAQGTVTIAAVPYQPSFSADIFWNGSTLAIINSSTSAPNTTFTASSTGNIIQIRWTNVAGTLTLANIYWTLKIYRIA